MSDTAPKSDLTLESMRADIASIIDLPPEEVGNDDNLMDLGLDSIRMLSLVVKWSESGMKFEFADLAEFLTLGDWWNVVKQLQASQNASGE